MPSKNTAKTVSARKVFALLTDSFPLVIICLAILVSYAVFTRTEYQTVRIHGQVYRLEIADTDGERASGLGGRRSLLRSQGMLFIYAQPARQCFWMKDMRFSLDMIWLDAQKRVIRIEHEVSPATYPAAFCADNAQYIVELNAGEAANAGLTVGQRITF